MENVNKKYNVKASIVSPLCVAQGGEKDWVEGIDYIRDNRILYHLNLKMMIDAGVPIHTLSSLFAVGDINGLRQLLLNRIEDVSDFELDMPVSTANPIKTFYFNPVTWKYVLFGSSIKGAIRSSLFHYLTIGENVQELQQQKNLDDFVFGSLKEGNNFMRFIRISDFDFEETELVNTKIYNLHLDGRGNWIGGWKHKGGKEGQTDCSFQDKGFNTIYECLMPNQSAVGSIMISPQLYKRALNNGYFQKEKDFIMDNNEPIHNLFRIINEATKDYIERELRYFEEYPQGEHSEEIIASLRNYHGIVSSLNRDKNSECLMKMAAGSGFHSITGDWQYDDFTDTGFNDRDGKKKYKSRKIACDGKHFSPMGFVRFSLV